MPKLGVYSIDPVTSASPSKPRDRCRSPGVIMMLSPRLVPVGLAALALILPAPVEAGIVTTVEGPGVQTSTASNTTVIDFDLSPQGYQSLAAFHPSASLTATYAGDFFILPADQYGGAGGAGKYLGIQSGPLATLSLSTPQA